MVNIIQTCSAIDNSATKIYQNLSSNASTVEFKQFWKGITPDEHRHSAYWARLLEWAQNGMLPQVFDKPKHIKAELETIHAKVIGLIERSNTVDNISAAFLIAFKLEFYLLHPSFETLFQYLKTLLKEETIEVDFDAQINVLFEALNKYGLETLELELLGETIHRLWEENKLMAIQNNNDPLTGVLNRRGLFNAIKPLSHLAQRNDYNIGIMMIDIDNFKEINDSLGHQAGDMFLRKIASTIKTNLRVSDLLGRYGGDEFLVFLPSVEPDAITAVGEKIRSSVEKATIKKTKITISIGLSQGKTGKDIDSCIKNLISKADKKLYTAKNAGRNRINI